MLGRGAGEGTEDTPEGLSELDDWVDEAADEDAEEEAELETNDVAEARGASELLGAIRLNALDVESEEILEDLNELLLISSSLSSSSLSLSSIWVND